MTSVPPVGRGSRSGPYERESGKIGKGRGKRPRSPRDSGDKGSGVMDNEDRLSGTSEELLEDGRDDRCSLVKTPRLQIESLEHIKKVILGEDSTDCRGMEITEEGEGTMDQLRSDTVTSREISVEKSNKDVTCRSDQSQPCLLEEQVESYFVINGSLKNSNQLDKAMQENLLGMSVRRFDPTTKGECKVICKIIDNQKISSKNKNCTKILVWCNKNQIFPTSVIMQKFNLALTTFKNAKYANDFLEKLDKLDNKWIVGFIDRRRVTCRGVITDWPFDIPELWENIVDRNDIIKIERMRRRMFDRTENKAKIVNTSNFIITMKGNKTKEELLICDNLRVGIRIRPYIERVIQCFNCFMFGHTKAYCKSEVRCFICGEKAHGECSKPVSCWNCRGEHKSTSRECPVFLRNKEIKVIMAYNNISFAEAENLIKGTAETRSHQLYDRYTNPNAWPKIKNIPPNRETNQATGRKISLDEPQQNKYGRNYGSRVEVRESFSKEKEKIEERRRAYVDYYKSSHFTENVPVTRGVVFQSTDRHIEGQDKGRVDIDKVIQYTKDKCRESEEFNRELLDLLGKYSVPQESYKEDNLEQESHYREGNKELVRKRINREKYQEEWRKARLLSSDMKRAYWEDRNEKEEGKLIRY